jgi:hypothetical protein
LKGRGFYPRRKSRRINRALGPEVPFACRTGYSSVLSRQAISDALRGLINDDSASRKLLLSSCNQRITCYNEVGIKEDQPSTPAGLFPF